MAASRRRHRRFPIQIHLDPSSVGVFTDSLIMNLSKGGVFLHVPKAEPVGSELDLEFTLPGTERKIRVKGRVIWSMDYEKAVNPGLQPGMGVKFTRISAADRAFLEGCIRRLSGQR